MDEFILEYLFILPLLSFLLLVLGAILFASMIKEGSEYAFWYLGGFLILTFALFFTWFVIANAKHLIEKRSYL